MTRTLDLTPWASRLLQFALLLLSYVLLFVMREPSTPNMSLLLFFGVFIVQMILEIRRLLGLCLSGSSFHPALFLVVILVPSYPSLSSPLPFSGITRLLIVQFFLQLYFQFYQGFVSAVKFYSWDRGTSIKSIKLHQKKINLL